MIAALMPVDGIPKTLVKDFGVVLVAIFSVHLIYELFLAREILREVAQAFRSEINRGQDIASKCSALGISGLFLKRGDYERAYPFTEWIDLLARNGGQLTVVGRTLFLMANKAELLEHALKHAKTEVHLALLSPMDRRKGRPYHDHDRNDIISALNTLQRKLMSPATVEKIAGQFTIKWHPVQTCDSYLRIQVDGIDLTVWEVSFGRDTDEKINFIVESESNLGKKLTTRHNAIVDASPVFACSAGRITSDKLTDVLVRLNRPDQGAMPAR